MGKLSLVTETTIAHRHRIFFVDALRGTAIIFMVMLHVPQYCRLNGDFWRTMADIFCMPLFFVLSGYVLNIHKTIFKKRATILIPFFFFGICCTIFFGKSLGSFFLSMDKNGYWFLWVIFVFNGCAVIIKHLKMNIHLGFLLFEIVFGLLYLLFSIRLRYLTSINECVMYWPFFYLGWLLRQLPLSSFVMRHRYIFLLTTFCAGLLHAYVSNRYPQIELLSSRVFALILIVMLFSLCFFYFGMKSAHGKMESFFSLLGSNTLQVYVLHYFVLKTFTFELIALPMKQLCRYSELWVSPFLSILVVLLSLLLSRLLYQLRLGFLFGRK